MSSGGAEDDIPQGERKTVTDFCYLLDKSKQLFNGLRTFDQRCFSTSESLCAIQKMTWMHIVNSSALGNTPYHRPLQCIHVYNKSGASKVGNQILLANRGQKKKALIVGLHMPGSRMTPRFDSSNMVLIEVNGNPVGTRIKTPIPTSLRKREGEYSKVLAIAQNFV